MNRIDTGSKCCGCAACADICPHNAIQMQSDCLGFPYPQIDNNKCVDCGLCNKVCDFKKPHDETKQQVLIAYAAKHWNQEEIKTSRSGAVFIALSDWILRNNGVIYGAGYGNAFQVMHKRATCKDERDEFKGSKYTQSITSDIFNHIKRDLIDGLYVMFTGTPCQTAALSSYLGEKLKKRLFIADIICHGVASPKIWDDYIKFLEEKEKQSITNVNFRDKEIFGWSGLHKESFVYEGQRKKTYHYTFYSDILLRKSCHECPYCNLDRHSDITLGDFWKWEHICPTMNTDDQGISLLLCNTEKGKAWFDDIKSELIVQQVDIKDCLQSNLKYPTPPHPMHDKFVKDYTEKGFKYIRRKYGNIGIRFHLSRCYNFIIRQYNRFIK